MRVCLHARSQGNRHGTRASASTETNDARTSRRLEARESAISFTFAQPMQRSPLSQQPIHDARSSLTPRLGPTSSAHTCASLRRTDPHASDCAAYSHHGGSRASASTETNDARTPRRRDTPWESAPPSCTPAQPMQRSSSSQQPIHGVRSSLPRLDQNSSAHTCASFSRSASFASDAASSHHSSPRARDLAGRTLVRFSSFGELVISGARSPRRFEYGSPRARESVTARVVQRSGSTGHGMSPSQLLITQIRGTNGDGLLALVELHGERFGPIHASAAMQQAARLSAHARVALKDIRKLVEVALRLVQGMQPRQLANTAWALAKLGHADAVFMDELVAVATPQLGSFKAQEVAMTRWALTTLGHADTDFMRALLSAATPHSFDPRTL
jgi:hypothetical protein